ncbi:MAG: SHOCT domain-containing protein [Promethearchaeota archaeon]
MGGSLIKEEVLDLLYFLKEIKLEQEDPLKILKIRLSKGEITLEEFNKLREIIK